MNRHGVSDYIPPDVLDGLQAVGRLAPIMKKRLDLVKMDRNRRKKAGQTRTQGHGGPVPQGSNESKTVEVD